MSQGNERNTAWACRWTRVAVRQAPDRSCLVDVQQQMGQDSQMAVSPLQPPAPHFSKSQCPAMACLGFVGADDMHQAQYDLI